MERERWILWVSKLLVSGMKVQVCLKILLIFWNSPKRLIGDSHDEHLSLPLCACHFDEAS